MHDREVYTGYCIELTNKMDFKSVESNRIDDSESRQDWFKFKD